MPRPGETDLSAADAKTDWIESQAVADDELYIGARTMHGRHSSEGGQSVRRSHCPCVDSRYIRASKRILALSSPSDMSVEGQ